MAAMALAIRRVYADDVKQPNPARPTSSTKTFQISQRVSPTGVMVEMKHAREGCKTSTTLCFKVTSEEAHLLQVITGESCQFLAVSVIAAQLKQ